MHLILTVVGEKAESLGGNARQAFTGRWLSGTGARLQLATSRSNQNAVGVSRADLIQRYWLHDHRHQHQWSLHQHRRRAAGTRQYGPHIHRLGIVHGDVKPGKIFMTPTGEVKLLDFGTVLMLDVTPQSDKGTAQLDQIRQLTPAYASPEMLMGEPRAESDDVYSLAVVAYFALTGTHPYPQRPANEALEENLTSARPANISPAQWCVLASGLCPKPPRPHPDSRRVRPASRQAALVLPPVRQRSPYVCRKGCKEASYGLSICSACRPPAHTCRLCRRQFAPPQL